MNNSMQKGFGFGITSGVITTLGLIVGLNSGTHLKLAVIGGILTIAIADAFSDALGIHLSEESVSKRVSKKTTKSIWEATISTFIAKFIVALTFIVPVLFLSLNQAVIASVIWGLLLLTIFSHRIAVHEKEKPWKVIGEHLLIAVVVIIATNFLGIWIASVFG
jgi:VIT1/CCC1 family predicted Fe2+/Mn2+ transporter